MKFKWDKKYLYWGVTAFLVIVCCILFFQLTNRWEIFVAAVNTVIKVLSPFIYGFVIAYLLNKVVVFFQRYVGTPLSNRIFRKEDGNREKGARIFAIIISYILFFGVIAGLLVLILPQLYYSIIGIVEKSSEYLNLGIQWLDETDIANTTLEKTAITWLRSAETYVTKYLETSLLPQMSTLITSITGGVITIAKTLINLFIGIIISIYMIYRKETFAAQVKKCVYGIFKIKTANKIVSEAGYLNTAFGSFISASLIDALIIGTVNYIFMLIMGMPYAALISIIVAVTNIIPMFGPVIGAVPSALLLLLESPVQCLIFVIFTVILQQLDGNVLKPRIFGDSLGLSGFWIIFAIVFFGGLFGIVGMVIGVPVMAVLYDAIRHRVGKKLKSRGLPETTDEYKNMVSVSEETGKPEYKY